MRSSSNLLLLVMICGMNSCALSPAAKPAELPALSTNFALSEELSKDVQQYLLKVHQLIQKPWVIDVLYRSKVSFPADHPANNPKLAVDLEMATQGDRSPGPVTIRKSSGYAPFDESALHVLGGVKALPPPPPSLGEGHLFLRWTFYRDARGCDPAYAQLTVVPYTPVEALMRSLKRKEYKKAYTILIQHRDQPALKVVLLEDTLSSGNLQQRKLALRLATTERLAKLFLEDQYAELRPKIIETLVQRKASVELTALLDRVTTDKTLSPDVLSKPWLLALLAALEKVKVTLPLNKLQALLSDKRSEVVLAAATLASKPAELVQASETWKNDPKMAGPLAVHRRFLGEDKDAEKLIRVALTGPGAMFTLETLRRYPVQAIAEDVADVVRNGLQIPARLKAIEVIVELKGPLSPLYTALLFKNTVLRIAAVRALGKLKVNGMGSSYRLVAIGLKERGPVAAEALAALATLGVDKFRGDVLRLMYLLKPEEQARVVSALWGFGKAVIPALEKMQQNSNKQIAEAASLSLQHLQPVKHSEGDSGAKANKTMSLEDLIRQELKS